MRTTLTIDDDVAVQLQRLRETQKRSLKAVVNNVLRAGLKETAPPKKRARPFRTRSVSLGRCLLSDVDDIADVLALAECEDFR